MKEKAPSRPEETSAGCGCPEMDGGPHTPGCPLYVPPGEQTREKENHQHAFEGDHVIALSEQEAFDRWNNTLPFDEIGDGTLAGALRAGFKGGWQMAQETAAPVPAQLSGYDIAKAASDSGVPLFKRGVTTEESDWVNLTSHDFERLANALLRKGEV